MPLPPPEDDRRPEPEVSLPTTKPFTDLKTDLKDMIQAYDVSTHLMPKQKFDLAYRIIGLGVYAVRMIHPSDTELEKRLGEIRDELKLIQPPHITMTVGLQEDMQVVVISSTSGIHHVLPSLAMQIHEKIVDQEYEQKVKDIDFLVKEVTVLCVQYKIIPYDFREEQSDYRGLDFDEAEDEPEEKQEEDGHEGDEEEDL